MFDVYCHHFARLSHSAVGKVRPKVKETTLDEINFGQKVAVRNVDNTNRVTCVSTLWTCDSLRLGLPRTSDTIETIKRLEWEDSNYLQGRVLRLLLYHFEIEIRNSNSRKTERKTERL